MSSLNTSDEAALDAYLDRIRFGGMLGRRLETLIALHRAHLCEISYENLDIHFGVPLEIDLEKTFRKIVIEGRGGWCFEMNLLFRWALERAGFALTLLRGTAAFEGDHMLLRVDISGTSYLADMGWGNGFLEPLPLVEGEHRQGFRRFALQRKDDQWRFSNLDFGDDGFTFDLAPPAPSDFVERSRFLQTDPESSFVRVVKGFRFAPDGRLFILRGAVLTTLSDTGKETTVIESAAEYDRVWRSVFRTPLPNIAELWPKVHADHAAWTLGKTNG